MKLLVPLFVAALLFSCRPAAAFPADAPPADTKEPAPGPTPADEEAVPNSYIVQFKEDVDSQAQIKAITSAMERENGREDNGGVESKVVYEYNIGDAFKGFAGTLAPRLLEELKADPAVAVVEPDRKVHATSVQPHPPSWGLTRISERNLDLSKPYIYPDSAGYATTVYVIDTGILISHPEFQGRARWGATFCSGCPDTDDNGHGTHVAGTIGSVSFGVAKKTNLVAVKVLAGDGSGTYSGVIAGINYVAARTRRAGQTSVANMSLGGPVSLTVNAAVQAAYNKGVSMVVAAGNENQNACNTSPASTPQAITVAASTRFDARAGFSNWGGCVDIFAPGKDITSTWNTGGTNTISGTSMASPHVAGAAALILGTIPSLTPADVAGIIADLATTNKITDPENTVNRLLFITDWDAATMRPTAEKKSE